MSIADAQAYEWLIAVAAIIVAVITISKFAYTAYKAIHRIDMTLGVDKKGRTISDRLDRVEHQLFPNGGSSLVDQMNRIAYDQKVIEGEVRVIKDYMGINRRTDDRV